MEKKLFTQDGKGYVVKTASNLLNNFINNPGIPLFKEVYVNYTNIPNEFSAHINTNKKIIPIGFNVSAIQVGGGIIKVDVSNCYYFIRSGNPLTLMGEYLNPLGKIFPYVQRVYYTNSEFNNFTIDYNKLIFHSNDFISIADKMVIYFTESLAGAMAGGNVPPFALLPGGATYIIAYSFTYLELI